MFLQHLCTPALIYLVIGLVMAVFKFFGKTKVNMSSFVFSLVGIFFITYLLDYVCKYKNETWSWVLLAILSIIFFTGGIRVYFHLYK